MQVLLIAALVGFSFFTHAHAANNQDVPAITFLHLSDGSRPSKWTESYKAVEDTWRDAYAGPLLEAISFARNPVISSELTKLLQKKTGKDYGLDIDRWYSWLWAQDLEPYEHYGDFKAKLYRLIDGRFADYFSDDHKAEIRLDEIRWGGVPQNGIPPLRNPKMLEADDADYLQDDNIVFGLKIGDSARAYPKRILAWHEMFVDTIEGEPVAGVYCTLCGSMILYKTTIGDKAYDMGTSGFLYRSNKLMFDEGTNSLWNTIWGTPSVGPLVGKGIELERLSIVTSTWGEWKKRHPDTLVLSLDTGHNRDYSEGNAYRSYFATDEIMFSVPKLDKRLKNKDEVLALIIDGKPQAFSSDFLRKNPIYHISSAKLPLVVFTDASGAHRVYHSEDVRFNSSDLVSSATDSSGQKWTITESELTTADGKALKRYPSHNAFWFGWYAANPKTTLVK